MGRCRERFDGGRFQAWVFAVAWAPWVSGCAKRVGFDVRILALDDALVGDGDQEAAPGLARRRAQRAVDVDALPDERRLVAGRR
jgi:hypothetical protein